MRRFRVWRAEDSSHVGILVTVQYDEGPAEAAAQYVHQYMVQDWPRTVHVSTREAGSRAKPKRWIVEPVTTYRARPV